MPTATAFDGTTVNSGTQYRVRLQPVGTSAEWRADSQLRARISQPPVEDAVSFGAREIEAVIGKGDGTAEATWRENVQKLFTPMDARLRLLEATHDDGVTAISVQVRVTSLAPDPTFPLFRVRFLAPDPVWRSTSTSTDSASPLTNAGDFTARPVITITPNTTTVRRRRITITDGGTSGLQNYLVVISFDGSGVSASAASNYDVFYEGVRIPFTVLSPGANPTLVFVRVNVPAGGSALLDIYYGSSVANTTTANTLNDGGMDLANAAFSNTNWIWDGFEATTYPNTTGVWVPAIVGQPTLSGGSFGITSVSPTNIVLAVAADASLANDANALVLVVGSKAGTTNALSGFLATLTVGATTVRGRVLYRKADDLTWRQATTRGTSGNLTAPLDIDDAVQIAIVLEATDATGSGSLDISSAGTFALALAGTPTVTVAAAVTARYIDSVLTNTTTGETITLDDLYMDDTTLEIDCLGKVINASTGPLYRRGISFSNPHEWMTLAVGSNTWTNPANAAAAFAWQSRYLI